jgi:hypothetical protein
VLLATFASLRWGEATVLDHLAVYVTNEPGLMVFCGEMGEPDRATADD